MAPNGFSQMFVKILFGKRKTALGGGCVTD